MQQNNLFKNNKPNNRFKIKKENIVVNLEENFKSQRIEQEMFTNYFESNKSIEYQILKKVYNDYKSGINILEKYFNNPNYLSLGPGQKEKINRVFRISMQITKKFMRHEEIGNVFKMNLKEEYCNDKIRFYFKKEKEQLCLLFIDLFHLGILTKNQVLKNEYNKYKKYTGNILNIKKN